MKSQVNRSPCASCLASSSWARFSPTSSMPASASAGRSSASTYFDRGEDLHLGADLLAHPLEVAPYAFRIHRAR